MKKHIIWGMLLLAGLATAQDKKSAVKELEQLSSENNSTEEQYNKSKSEKSYGQNSYGRGDRFVCESYRGQRNHCRADTSGGVRLVRQMGYNSCQGNWGYDYYGVWVTNGCHAEFQIDRYQDHYGQTEDIIRCESYSYRRQTCARNLNGAEVRLIHQLSNRSCRGNWGYSQNEIWVANGCKADFLVISNNYNDPYNSGNYQNGIVECRSQGTNINHCQVPELQSIELIEEIGGRYGECRGNWGYSSHGLWVRRGCQARFRVTEYQANNNYNNPNYPNNNGREIVCESSYGQVRTCVADTSGGVELIQPIASSNCNQRWGYDHNGIWVKDGCRARFMTYPGGSTSQPPVRESFTIKCKSRRDKLKICDTNGPFLDVEFKREISKGKYPCEGNWGVNQQGELFVTNNCYAEFRIFK